MNQGVGHDDTIGRTDEFAYGLFDVLFLSEDGLVICLGLLL